MTDPDRPYTGAAWAIGTVLGALAVALVLVLASGPGSDLPAPVPARPPTTSTTTTVTAPDPVEVLAELRRLRAAICVWLDEVGRDSLSPIDYEACGP